MSKLKIYKASAGSGKTFSLAREYLLLVLRDPQNYRFILGVTFTNKSTAEMKRRIVQELELLATASGKSGHSDYLCAEFGLDLEQLANKARVVLRAILHDYGRFTVSTIDSFFQRLVRSFAREIGLNAGFKLELDTQIVLHEVLEKLIQSLSADTPTTQWLTRFAMSRVEQGKNWNFRQDLKNLGSEIFKEKFQLLEREIIRLLGDTSTTEAYFTQQQAQVRTFENTLKQLGKKGVALMQQHGLEPIQFNGKGRSFVLQFQKWMDGTYEPTATAIRFASEPLEKWPASDGSASDKERVIAAAQAGLQQWLAEGVAYFEKEESTYLTARAISQYAYQFLLVADLLQLTRAYRDEHDLMLLSDTGSLLNRIMGDNSESFIFEKMGTTFKHFLIDEFQDTSRLQWENFKPLISNSISEGNFSMLVGDVKQSIYRFRNGDWKLLLRDAERDIPYSETVYLTTNWRSKEAIVQFNNAIFDTAPALIAQKYKNELAETGSDEYLDALSDVFTKAYEQQAQKIPDKPEKKGGWVCVDIVRKTEEDDWKTLSLRQMGQHIIALQNAGAKAKEMVVLVRTTAEAQLVSSYLSDLKQQPEAAGINLEVISDQSTRLAANSAVRVLLATLHLMVHDHDPIQRGGYRYELEVYVRNRDALNLHDLFDQGLSENSMEAILDTYLGNAEALKSIHFPDLVHEIIVRLELGKRPEHALYIQFFQDVVHEFCKKNTPSIKHFLAWWDEEGWSKGVQLSDDQDAIRLMTIHKSKGLEFPMVLIPFCSWSVDNAAYHEQLLWCKPTEEPYNTLPIVPVKYEKALASTIFKTDYFEEKQSAYLDNLNVLYVAFTRAADVLWVGINGAANSTTGADISGVLQASLESLSQHEPFSACFNAEKNRFSWGEFPTQHSTHTKENSSNYLQLTPAVTAQAQRPITIKRSAITAIWELSEEDDSKRRMGIKLHAILAKIVHARDLERALQNAIFEGLIAQHEITEYRHELESFMRDPAIQFIFDPSWHVRTECPILIPGKGRIIPDRVLTRGSEAIVIDFKTGQPAPYYAHQLRMYMQALQAMHYPNVQGYIVYTEPLKIEPVYAR